MTDEFTPVFRGERVLICNPLAEMSEEQLGEFREHMRKMRREFQFRIECLIINGYCNHETHDVPSLLS